MCKVKLSEGVLTYVGWHSEIKNVKSLVKLYFIMVAIVALLQEQSCCMSGRNIVIT